MTTQELKNKIEKVLGNNIRCLLPSYWWKNLFHSVADKIDEVEQKIDGIEIPDGLPIVSSIAELDSLNLNKGRVASVVDGIGFSQCYQPTDEELSSLASSKELHSKLTRVESIDIKNNSLEEGEVGVANLVDFRGIETELSYLTIICFKQYKTELTYAQGIISGQEVFLLLVPGNIEKINKILSEYDMRFITAKLDGLFEGEPEDSLAALDKKFAINIDVDVYVKGITWERFLKENTNEGTNTDEIPSIHFVDFNDNDDYYGFTIAGWEKMKTIMDTNYPESLKENLQTTVEEYFASNIHLYNDIVSRNQDKAEGFIAYIDQGKFYSELFSEGVNATVYLSGKWLVMVNTAMSNGSNEVYLYPIYGNSDTTASMFSESYRTLKLNPTGEVEVICRTPFTFYPKTPLSAQKEVNKKFVKYWNEAFNSDSDIVGVLPTEKLYLADGTRLLSTEFSATKFVGTYFDGTSLMEITIDGTTGEATSKNVGTLLTTKVEFEEFTTKAEMEVSEKVTAAALNDLNTRLNEVVNRLDALDNN